MENSRMIPSRYISNSIVHTRVNDVIEKLAGLFFRGVTFDSESAQTLANYRGKGRSVYVSFQSSSTPLFILVNLLRKSGAPVPDLALDFTPSLPQMIVNLGTAASYLFKKYILRKKIEKISDFDYIRGLIQGNRALILSLLSRKLFIRRYIEIKSDTIQYLVEVQKLIDEPIFIFPQMLFWNQNPERTHSLVTARATGDRGFISGLLTVLKSTTPSFVRIPPPLNLKEEISRSMNDDPKQIARRIRYRLLEIYNNEKRTILGPVIKSQQEMMEKVLYHKNVLDDIGEIMSADRQPEKKLRRKAYRYFREIAADFSIVNIKWFNAAVQYMFRRIFDGIYFNIDDLKMVREAAQKAPLILVPSHKSHMDYLIVSSIFYQNKIIPPHIVAGSNLTFFPMGILFRKSGAFFMRRSFKGLKLYPSIFKQYIKTLICEGYSIEFFIEGGRSRTGKIMQPKMGILKYLIDAIEEGYNKDMIFVPLTISYDRILEESSYHMEMKGKEKEKESTSTFVQSRKLLRRKYGKVYLSFNESFSFKEYRDGLKEGEDITESLGHYITRRISETIIATPFAVTSAAMLLTSDREFKRDSLKRRFGILHEYLMHLRVRMSDTMQDPSKYDEIINYVIESYQQDKIIVEQAAPGVDGGDSVPLGVYTINENERARINFYKNSITHYFLPITYLSAILLNFAGSGEMDAGALHEKFIELRDLFSEDFIYSEEMLNPAEIITGTLEYMERRSMVALRDGKIAVRGEGREELVIYAKAIQDILESYLVVCDAISLVGKKLSRKELVHEVRKNGMRLYQTGDIKLSESLSMPIYENVILKLNKIEILDIVHSGRKQVDVTVRDADRVAEVKQRIESYLRTLQKM